MHDSDLWAIEEQLWTAGEAFYRQRLDAGALMVLPSYGVMDREAVLDVVRERPCSRRASLRDRLIFAPSQEVAVLAYTVHALKREGHHFNGRCKSTYLRIDGQWLLVMHHQTRIQKPFDDEEDLLHSTVNTVSSVAARVFGPLVGHRAKGAEVLGAGARHRERAGEGLHDAVALRDMGRLDLARGKL